MARSFSVEDLLARRPMDESSELHALFHRLNNQLGIILAHAELLEAKVPDAMNRARARQVVASALESHAILTDENAIETVTTMSIEEVIKGPLHGDTFEVIEPGGLYRDRGTFIPGIPRFQDGERSLLFLVKTAAGWRVRNIALGKFSFATELGRTYTVQYTDSLVPANWQSAPSFIGDGSIVTITDPTRQMRFYRVLVQ